MKGHNPWSFRASSWGIALVFFLIALLPVIAAFVPAPAAGGEEARPWLHAFRSVLLEGRQVTLLGNSLAIAIGTTVAATLLGVAAGFALEYLRVPGRRLLACAMAVSFLIPPYVDAVAWIELLGNNGVITHLVRNVSGDTRSFAGLCSVPGAVFVLALSHYPIVALVTALAIRGFDARLEEAALLVGPAHRTVWCVILPMIGPSIVAGSLFVFVLTLMNFSVPSLLTVNVYPVEIYSRFSSFHDFQEAAALALPLLVLGAIAVVEWRLCISPGHAWLTGARRHRTVLPGNGLLRAGAAVFCWLLVITSAGLPLFILIRRALPVSSFVQAFHSAKEEIFTSLMVAACSATILCLLGFFMAYLARRGSGRLYAASFLPFLISGPVLGIGLIRLWNHDGALALVYDTVVIMVLACVARYVVFAHQGAAAALYDLHPRLEEAASIFGVSWWRQVTGVVLPLTAPALIGTWSLAFLFSFAELDAVILVYPPGLTTLPVRLFSLMHYGPNQMVAALSLITVVTIVSIAALAACIWAHAKRRLDARY